MVAIAAGGVGFLLGGAEVAVASVTLALVVSRVVRLARQPAR